MLFREIGRLMSKNAELFRNATLFWALLFLPANMFNRKEVQNFFKSSNSNSKSVNVYLLLLLLRERVLSFVILFLPCAHVTKEIVTRADAVLFAASQAVSRGSYNSYVCRNVLLLFLILIFKLIL